jgi:hypothetical protein
VCLGPAARSAIPALVNALADPRARGGNPAWVLRGLGPQALPSLVAALKGAGPELQGEIAWILEGMGPPAR